MELKTIGVIGAGQMGAGIAHVLAMAGIDTILIDIRDDLIANGMAGIGKNLQRQVDKGRIAADDRQAALDRIRTGTAMDLLANADMAIEAATENESLKFDIFRQMDAICPAHAILATNTSSIPIGRIGAVTGRPEKVIGMHFMNPVPVMDLVEIIRSLSTDDATFKAVHDLTLTLEKTPAASNDRPGFIANRILMPMINEAIFCLEQGVGTPEAIDTVMTLGMRHPMGPLTLADLIGLDTCLAIMETLHDGFKDGKYRPCPLLRQYVEAGWLGRKTGRGFYDYA